MLSGLRWPLDHHVLMQSSSIVAAADRLAAGPQRRLTGGGRLVTIRFSGECPGPRKSTTVRLNWPDDLLGHLGVQDRLHVSTIVVSTVLAAGLCSSRSRCQRRESAALGRHGSGSAKLGLQAKRGSAGCHYAVLYGCPKPTSAGKTS